MNYEFWILIDMPDQVGYMKKFPEGRIRPARDWELGKVLMGGKPADFDGVELHLGRQARLSVRSLIGWSSHCRAPIID